jgi:hypothetical protein
MLYLYSDSSFERRIGHINVHMINGIGVRLFLTENNYLLLAGGIEVLHNENILKFGYMVSEGFSLEIDFRNKSVTKTDYDVSTTLDVFDMNLFLRYSFF